MRAKQFEYVVDVQQDGTALAEGRSPSAQDLTWTPEHLLLEALARCTLLSLRFHADRAGVAVDARASASAVVTRPKAEQRFRLVEIACRLHVRLDPLPETPAVEQLLAQAEHDCFVGASLKPPTAYEWHVNGERREASGSPKALRVPQAPRPSEAPRPHEVVLDTAGLACSRCGQAAPPGDSAEWRVWNPADLGPEELTDAVAALGLICPDCREEEQTPEELGGGA